MHTSVQELTKVIYKLTTPNWAPISPEGTLVRKLNKNPNGPPQARRVHKITITKENCIKEPKNEEHESEPQP